MVEAKQSLDLTVFTDFKISIASSLPFRNNRAALLFQERTYENTDPDRQTVQVQNKSVDD
jgi:hypothetical protein